MRTWLTVNIALEKMFKMIRWRTIEKLFAMIDLGSVFITPATTSASLSFNVGHGCTVKQPSEGQLNGLGGGPFDINLQVR